VSHVRELVGSSLGVKEKFVSSYAGRSRKYKKKQAKRSKIGKWED
jgi:hypothetical protein